jgi:hypothetical protein
VVLQFLDDVETKNRSLRSVVQNMNADQPGQKFLVTIAFDVNQFHHSIDWMSINDPTIKRFFYDVKVTVAQLKVSSLKPTKYLL